MVGHIFNSVPENSFEIHLCEFYADISKFLISNLVELSPPYYALLFNVHLMFSAKKRSE